MASEPEVLTLMTAFTLTAVNQAEGHSLMKLTELHHQQKAGDQTVLYSARP